MTVVTRTHFLRPYSLRGAAQESRERSIRRLLDLGLLRDHLGRKCVLLSYEEAEKRLKERRVEE